ncbi:MAG: hypothetical protein JNM18_25780 [Planctomycetaceae bacterium]|nr:hypothetical protein [Planctomycetaceae bacterium]
MKRRSTLAWFAWVMLSTLVVVAAPGDAQWKKVQDAMNQGLPKTAIDELRPIITKAIADKRWAEAVRAVGQKIALEGTIEGNKPEEKIARMAVEIAQAPAEMQPMLQAIQAHWYWHYFQHNRWRFMQRSRTAAAPGNDITTWDLPRILQEIDQQFAASLKSADQLKQIKITEYNDLIESGTLPDMYRPTLYDFMAHSALEFYAAGEQAGNQAEDAFEASADSPLLGGLDEFLAWQPQTTDENSLKLRAIRLYQDLLRFHRDDADVPARLDTDLLRLIYAKNIAVGDEKEERYLAAMQRLADANATHELSSKALYHVAQQLFDDGDRVEARRVALQGKQRFPQSIGGKLCHNLIVEIEAKGSQITIERVWNEPRPTIDVQYRNLTKIYFRAVPFDFEAWLKSAKQRYNVMQMDQNERKALLAKPAALSWNADLPATDDYKDRIERLPAPAGVKPGSYYLIASHDEQFRENDNAITFQDFWVSDLALVIRTNAMPNVVDGFVLHAVTGEPLANAEVRLYSRDRNGNVGVNNTTKTDANGLFKLNDKSQGNGYHQHMMYVLHPTGRIVSNGDFWLGGGGGQAANGESTVLFTDRSIYRPGQAIHYKGICIGFDQPRDNYRTLGKRGVAIVFNDVNGKEIERRDVVTNDYGSFSGSFTAPRDRLMGRMNIQALGPQGATQVTVEEYKRPKFQVKLDAPKEAAKLDGDVSLVGKATAYTGSAIDAANVRWRVVREVRYPAWWYWRMWWMPANNNSQEIAHGAATTDTLGNFTIKFTAKPDRSVKPEDEPTFHYSIHADVTDSSGETRSDQRGINVGYTALSASLAADEWQTVAKPVTIRLSTTTLDGEGQAAAGTLKVYRVVEPEKVIRPSLSQPYPGQPSNPRRGRGPRAAIIKPQAPPSDPSNVNSWPTGDVAFEQAVQTDATGALSIDAKLPVGLYRAKLETQDRFGKTVTAELPLRVIDPAAEKLAIKIPDLFASEKASYEPGQEYVGVWGTGYEQGRAFVEVEHRQKILRSYWTVTGRTQEQIKLPIDESMRGGFQVRITRVRENRAYLHARTVTVPWTNKQLTLKWEHFVSKLEPGQKEKWTAVVTGPNAKHAVAEMVAAMYDASLDQYLPHQWPGAFGVFRHDYSYLQSRFENQANPLQWLLGQWTSRHMDASYRYRALPQELIANLWGYQFGGGRNRGLALGAANGRAMPAAAAPMMAEGAAMDAVPMAKAARDESQLRRADRKELEQDKQQAGVGGTATGPQPNLSKIAPRKNLQETAFFYPHLISNSDGEVRIEFQMPEALTEWKFLGFAHDRELRSGLLTGTTVTAKEIMVQPNPPRFLREGDTLAFTAKVSNQSAGRQTGKIKLTLTDARTGQNVDTLLGNTQSELDFDIAANESRSFAWLLKVPDDAGFLQYTVVGSTGRLSDGEEGFLPVLSRRILVTESLPLPIRGAQTKQFDFTKLGQSGGSDTLRHQSLTVQMVSNPSWYAVMALPYLMEYPYECSEQSFNRLYANALARHIAQSDPKIHRVFEQWRGTPALESPLMKNQDLKSVMIEETPWLRDAQNESQARRNVGILFDDNRLNSEVERIMQKLAEQQLENGAWPWFPGGPANDYITFYITTGFGRLRHLGVKLDMAPAIRSLDRLDAWMEENYRRILQHSDPTKNHLSTTAALYLYCRSFYRTDKPIQPQHQEAFDFWIKQARTYWLQLAHRQSQAHLAIALKRFAHDESAQAIVKSLKERSVSNEELGMFWRELELSWWWYHAPIETQAMMIEAFDEVAGDAAAVEDCKVWLLKQKQTQNWKTTKATADAVYALLLRGSNGLASDALVEVALGGEAIKPQQVEAGTGFYEQRFTRGEIKPELAKITVKKTDPGVAWGSVHWQYLEDMSKVTPYEGTPLKLKKSLFTKQPSKAGPVLEPVTGAVKVGDELVVRVELRVDRDMEYVHLKDYRGSGTEPVNVLSQYKYQDGLAYYESTRDTASHFFIDYLPKGVYVFEYSTRVQHRGKYQTGLAEIQCMYAPEFNSHSESTWLTVE